MSKSTYRNDRSADRAGYPTAGGDTSRSVSRTLSAASSDLPVDMAENPRPLHPWDPETTNRVFADTFYFLAILNTKDAAHEKAVPVFGPGIFPC